MNPSRLLLPGLFVTLALLVAACSSGSSATPRPSPTATIAVVMATPTSSAPTPAASVAPLPGAACPVPVAVCQFAADMERILETGDADAFFAAARPVMATCAAEPARNMTAAVCAGAAPGDTRPGYWALQGGEGLIVTEAELRGGLVRWFDAIARASTISDGYGPGELRVGSVSCTRRADQPSGVCLGNSIQAHFTFINPQENVSGTGTAGERISFHVSASVIDNVLYANGIGTVVPPNSVLSASTINIQDGQGNPMLVEVYPWTR